MMESELVSTAYDITIDDAVDTDVASTILFPKRSQLQFAWLDMKDGLLQWRIWLMLAYQDIKLRYRRSVLGPFWLTISMGVTVYSMGFLYAKLFHVEMQRYYPFLVAGMLSWSLISTIIVDLTDGLVASDAFIKQIKLPYSLYIHRIAARNVLIFFHNIIVMIPILAIFHEYARVNFNTLLMLVGLLFIYFNSITYGLILGMIGARYRDISQIIKSLVQVVFFVTPVMWSPDVFNEYHRNLINLNPFYAFIELIRAPLLGQVPTAVNFIIVIISTLLGATICAWMFIRYRSRIVYWL